MEQPQNSQHVQEQGQQQQPAPDAQAQEQQHAAALAAKDQEIQQLRAELDALKKAPGASTSHVVEEKKDNPQEQPSAIEDFFETRKRATELYNLVP